MRLRRLSTVDLDHVVGGACDLSSLSGAARSIIMAESSGDPTAQNPTTSAFGLPQMIVSNRLSILGDDYDTVDCGKQLGAYHAYVKQRYRGSDARALAFRRKKGWY